MNTYEELTGSYPLIKTINLALNPIGETLRHIEEKGFIAQDEQRAEDYEKVKDIIDRYHKYFITMCLDEFKFSTDKLMKYVALAEDSKRDEDAFDEVKTQLRKEIVAAFEKGETYNDLFKKKLILKHLPNFVTDEMRSAWWPVSTSSPPISRNSINAERICILMRPSLLPSLTDLYMKICPCFTIT